MVQDVSAAVLAKSIGVSPQPVWLLEVITKLAAPDDFLRWTNYSRNVLWPDPSGDTFTRRAFEVPAYTLEAAAEGKASQIAIADADSFIRDLIEDDSWEPRGKRILLRRIDRGAVSSSTDRYAFTFIVDTYEHAEYEWKPVLAPLRALYRRLIPSTTYNRSDPDTGHKGIPPD